MQPDYARPADVLQPLNELLRPPKRVPVSDTAEKYCYAVGRTQVTTTLNLDLTPYMREPMNMARSRQYRGLAVIAPAQSGKTAAMVDAQVVHTIVSDPATLMLVQTTKDEARKHKMLRINQLHRHPAIGRYVSIDSHDDNLYDVNYRHGMSLLMSWPVISHLSGKPIKTVLLTDYDRMPLDINHEGTVFDQALGRTRTFMSSGMVIAESSINPDRECLDEDWTETEPHELPPAPGITAIYNRGTRARLYWPCPHCNDYFMIGPGISKLTYIESDDIAECAESARLVCEHCAATIEFSQRRAMSAAGLWVHAGQSIKKGKVIGDKIKTDIASYLIDGVAANWQRWDDLIRWRLEAERIFKHTGDETQLKTTVTVNEGNVYTSRNKTLRGLHKVLQSRAERYEQRCLPEGVIFLTCAIDVQINRFVVQVEGWGKELENWLIDRYDISLSPSRRNEAGDLLPIEPHKFAEDWAALLEIIRASYPFEDDPEKRLPIMCTACDSAGASGVTKNALAFYRELRRSKYNSVLYQPRMRRDPYFRHHKFFLLRGAGAGRTIKGRLKVTYPDSTYRSDRQSRSRGDIPIFEVDTRTFKDDVAVTMHDDNETGRVRHYPDWLSEDFFKELSAEIRTPTGWKKRNHTRPNEAFDLHCYNRAITVEIGAEVVDWESHSYPVLGESDKDDRDEPPKAAVRPMRSRRPSFIHRHRR